MNKITLFFLFSFFCFYSQADWADLNTGINDDLTGIVFKNSRGLVSGKKGLYYTSNGGVGAANWTRFNISVNTQDSIIYNNTQFTHCYSNPTDIAADISYYACGEDTVNHKAVLIKIHSTSLSYTILYYGSANSRLNAISQHTNSGTYYAVGNSGLILSFTSASLTPNQVSNLNLTDHLKAVEFLGNDFSLLAPGISYRGEVNSNTLSIQFSPTLPYSVQGMYLYNETKIYMAGTGFHSAGFSSVNTYENYDFGPLNARCITRNSAYLFVGTDHGIFKSAGTTSYESSALEWQPSSGQHAITEFWFSDNNQTFFYACGEDGLVLRTTQQGGETKPFAKILFNGACLTLASPTVSCLGGSSTNYSWFRNNIPCGSGATFNLNFASAGSYEMRLICSNGTYSDTVTKTVHIVNTPQINKPVFIPDPNLCKLEPVILQIDSSETNVFYTLKSFLSLFESYGASASGNGGVLNFTSSNLDTGGDYYLVASSSLANCSRYFSDTIRINVEHTKAAFYSNKINALPGEEIRFFDRCIDAQNYKWTFANQAQDSISILPDPINNFAAYGNVGVKLVCWSDFGCYDSIQQNSTRIYTDNNDIDSCWTVVSKGFDMDYIEANNEDISEFSKSKTGFFVCGTYHDYTFSTRFGDSLKLPEQGAYLIKYDRKGVAKWIVRTIQENDNSPAAVPEDWIGSVVEDQQGNVYLSGYGQGRFVDNAGDTTLFFSDNFLLKLDSLGKMLWSREGSYLGSVPRGLSIDNDNNVVALIAYQSQYPSVTFRLNRVLTDTLYTVTPTTGWNRVYLVLKIAPDGQLVRYYEFCTQTGNYSDNTCKITFDLENNMYLAGTYESGATFYSADHPASGSISGGSSSGAKMFLVKYDSSGIFQWKVNSYTMNSLSDRTQALYIHTDSLGNSYVSGTNNFSQPTSPQRVNNADGTTATLQAGKYFISKFNTHGICQWIYGAATTSYGYGQAICQKGDEIFVGGTIQNSGEETCTANFSGSYGSSVSLTINQSDFFIAVYSQDGILERILKNGNNTSYNNNRFFTGFFPDGQGNFFTSANMRFYDQFTLYSNFSDVLDPQDYYEYEGSYTKFNENCAISAYPSYHPSVGVYVCPGQSYEFPDGFIENNILSPTTHASYFTTINGLDSTITTTVSPQNHPIFNEQQTICAGSAFTFPDGTFQDNITDTLSHTNYLQSSIGCDSIVVTRIEIQLPYTAHDSVTICFGENYTFPDLTFENGITDSMSHTSYLQSSLGCDSTIITHIRVQSLYLLEDSLTVCTGSSYTFPDGTLQENIYETVIHTSLLQNYLGCDSTIQLTVTPVSVGTEIEITGNTLISQETDALFQWLNCLEDFNPVTGANASSFTPAVSGNYALEITKQECTDTSGCIAFYFAGLETLAENIGDWIYPNPSDGIFHLSVQQYEDGMSYKLFNALGQELMHAALTSPQTKLSLDLAAGSYTIVLNRLNGIKTYFILLKE